MEFLLWPFVIVMIAYYVLAGVLSLLAATAIIWIPLLVVVVLIVVGIISALVSVPARKPAPSPRQSVQKGIAPPSTPARPARLDYNYDPLPREDRYAPYRHGPSAAEVAKVRAAARANADTAFITGLIIGAAIEDRRHHQDSGSYGGGDCDSDNWNC